MKTRLPVPLRRARSRTAESWRASVRFAAFCGACVLGASQAHAWVGSQGESSNVASRLSGAAPAAPAPSSGPSSVASSDVSSDVSLAPSQAEVSQQLSGLARVLPQDPNPVPLQIPADLTQEQLRGGYGFALALWLFSGLLLTSTLVLLFGHLAYQRWFVAAPSPSRHPSPPSRRSSPSHR